MKKLLKNFYTEIELSIVIMGDQYRQRLHETRTLEYKKAISSVLIEEDLHVLYTHYKMEIKHINRNKKC